MAATFFMVSGGPYGIEDIIGGAGVQVGLRAAAVSAFPVEPADSPDDWRTRERIPGGTMVCVLIGIPPAVLIAAALLMARGERIAEIPALGLASAIALLGPVAYAIQTPWSRNRQSALTNSPETGETAG